ncbi:MAG: hypothetical protein QX196_10235 [Methylococcaceae bacterium]
MESINEYIAYLEIFKPMQLPFFTFVGCFTLYVLNRLQNKQPFSIYTALNKMGNTATPKTILGDIFFSSLLGTFVVMSLTSPETTSQALFAGLGMTGVLSPYAKNIGE